MTLPNFLIIGAAKAGTTSLYYYLKQHPQIYMSPQKEPRFFALERGIYSDDFIKVKLAHATLTLEAYQWLFNQVKKETAIGEADPLNLYSPKAPKKIKHYIPNAKLIAILRDPVERAYSHFCYRVSKGIGPFDFAEALLQEDRNMNINLYGHIRRIGFYYGQLKRYFDLFRKNQIRVYLYEDFKCDPIKMLLDIFSFLEIDNTFIPDISQHANVTQGIKEMSRIEIIDKILTQPNQLKSLLKPLIPKQIRFYLTNTIKYHNTAPLALLHVSASYSSSILSSNSV